MIYEKFNSRPMQIKINNHKISESHKFSYDIRIHNNHKICICNWNYLEIKNIYDKKHLTSCFETISNLNH